jgi:pyridoxal phosphate-dependent aminotransferase EpsN
VLHALRSQRRLVSLAAYGAITVIAYLAAFVVRFDLAWRPAYAGTVVRSLAVLVAVRLLAAHAFRLSAQRWRFVGTRDVRRLVTAVGMGSIVFVPLAWALNFEPRIPRTILVLEPALTILLTAGLWLSYRTLFELTRRRDLEIESVRNVVVVGAGEAGETLVRQMERHPTGYRAVAFADDDPVRQGALVHGIEVLGGTEELRDIVQRTGADEIVIAIPSADPATLRRIVQCCQTTDLPYRVLPGIEAVLEGDVSLTQLREVRIEDLLGRDPVKLDLPELARDLAGQTVLITGAAGSIGSELARQAARHRPRRLVLLDQSETGLFYLELELRDAAPEIEVIPVVADIVDAAAVERVFAVHRPGRVFHAAAYKHVPMMETNAREALRNNVIGTWRVAAAAGRHGTEKFVLVSTDKAVRPANVMGATKRVAELLVLELQEAYPQTEFGAVRFGNVLGSAGSVIPVFKRQLEAGKPLTVTHPDVTRYFMTVPEASQLVLQASLLPELRGRIAMLEMGEPVRIVELARTLVRLAGGGRRDGAIVFTGLRPGEKLNEELVAPGERASATAIPKVRILDPEGDTRRGVLARMPHWSRLLADWRPEPVVAELAQLVPELEERRSAAQGTAAGAGTGRGSDARTGGSSWRPGRGVPRPGAPPRILLSPPHLGSEEQQLVSGAIASNWVAPAGPDVDAFERELAAVVGSPDAAAVSSGTAALHLALRLAGVGEGDTVFVSTLTFVASVNPVLYLGATPYFIDSERRSWNMDPALLADALEAHARRGRLPKAVVLVHLYGQCADIAPIKDVCDRHGVTLVEDAAEALGATYHGRAPGTFGAFGAYSFNGNKIITTSGGGMLVSGDLEAVARARKLASQAREPAAHYEHVEVGHNYRLSNILAALGRAQLRQLEVRVAARRHVFAAYEDALGDLPGLAFMPEAPWGRSTRWLTCLTIDADEFGADRDEVLQALAAENVEARPVWKPMHQQPLFAGLGVAGGSVADDLFARGMCLPSGSALTSEQLERVVGVVRRVAVSARRRGRVPAGAFAS